MALHTTPETSRNEEKIEPREFHGQEVGGQASDRNGKHDKCEGINDRRDEEASECSKGDRVADKSREKDKLPKVEGRRESDALNTKIPYRAVQRKRQSLGRDRRNWNAKKKQLKNKEQN